MDKILLERQEETMGCRDMRTAEDDSLGGTLTLRLPKINAQSCNDDPALQFRALPFRVFVTGRAHQAQPYCTSSASWRQLVFHDLSALHHELDSLQFGD